MDRQWLDKAMSTQDHLVNVARLLTIRERLRHRARVIPALASKVHADYYSVSIGATRSNASKNRYADIHPYDRTRVIPPIQNTSRITNDDDDDEGNNDHVRVRPYLNASWVRERVGGTWWIASQAPLPKTAHAFLSLLLAPVANPHAPSAAPQPVRTVIQLAPFRERGMRKADPYFPTTVGESLVVPAPDGRGPALKTTLLSVEARPDACCVHSRVAVLPVPPTPAATSSASSPSSPSSSAPQPIVFDHLFFVSWPDHGAPRADERPELLAFMRLAERINKAAAASAASPSRADGPVSRDTPCAVDPPIVVGCSAGVGRTGSYIALASLLRAYGLLSDAPPPAAAAPPPLPESPLGPLPDAISADLVAQEVDALREQRPGMVESLQQLSLIYDVLMFALAERRGVNR